MIESAVPEMSAQVALWQETLQWCPDAEIQQRFQALYQGILAGNQQMNLTRLTAPDEFWEKHLWDSFSGLSPWLVPPEQRPDWATHPAAKVIDIGTGAGFPGFPTAIAFPDWQITLLDSTQKKVRFLQELVQSLALENVRAIADRAEFLGHQLSHREFYDLALLRAVGSAPTCAEYALPLVKVGGIVILYRGQWTEAENQQLKAAAEQLGGHILTVQEWRTPLTQGVRHCIYLQKHAETDEDFPRPVGIPTKQPLPESE